MVGVVIRRWSETHMREAAVAVLVVERENDLNTRANESGRAAFTALLLRDDVAQPSKTDVSICCAARASKTTSHTIKQTLGHKEKKTKEQIGAGDNEATRISNHSGKRGSLCL